MPRSLAHVTRSTLDIAGRRDLGSGCMIRENEFFSFGQLYDHTIAVRPC